MPTASKAPSSRATADDNTRILDAALLQFQRVGVKKTTIEDVAREAGVDRVTVYRRVGSRDNLVTAVFSREVALVLAELALIPERHGNIGDLITEMFMTVLNRWRAHPVAERMLMVEPERVVMKLTVDGADIFTMAVAATTHAMERAVERELLAPASDLTARAEIACRIVHSLILLPHATLELETDSQLREFARTYLLPIVTGLPA
ncbi:TetR family transcriptional regulator [Nocardia sp. SYP-A9097]|uniref:TetR/AcrR family transcriptional regulator n=1 Tax=Nocardia sp. SYP-A9097 TaxID=2663237 RepID=UPI001327943E|nr:helix-turn-helix domain-containing protein [Nocardia sp. SYP-A9097]MRH89888.1 TetR family transcriptional regulator [Nocardia sp. SYP-A9097]